MLLLLPKKRFVSGYVAMMLACCLIAIIGTSGTETKIAQTGNQESILRDQVVDLIRLSSLQSHGAKQQDQPDQIALANHESVVLDNTAALLPQILMMASGSAPLPHGRRRLDAESSGLVALPTNKRQLKLALGSSQFKAQASRSGQSRQRSNGASNQFDKIVDDGSSSQLGVNSIPHTALMAMMANNNFNRLALASAGRLQRAQAAAADQINARGRSKRDQQINRRSLRQSQMGARPMPAHMNRPQESKLASKRTRGKPASEPLNEFNDNDERDEMTNRSGESGDYDDDDETNASERDDERSNSRSRSTRRQSNDDIFNELDDDQSSADEGGYDDAPAPRARSASEQQRHLKEAATRKQINGNVQTGTPRRAYQGEDIDEDIDSTDARQLVIRKRADSVGQSMRQQQQQLLSGPMITKTPEVATVVDDEMSQPGQSNNQPQQIDSSKPDGDDDLSAASYVRNTAADLQTAAGKHYGGHHYHQMVEVPKKKAYKMSFKRGNHKHEISKKEKLHKHKFHTKFMWHAKEKCKKKKKCKSVGKMTWEYKHDKKHHHS